MKLALTFVLALTPLAAHAFTSVPGHADIKVKASKTRNGVVRGCTLTFCVRTPMGGYPGAFPGLFDPAKVQALKGSQNRAAVINPDHNHIRVALPYVPVGAVGQAFPVTVEIDYDQHGLSSGETLTLVTAWPGTGQVSEQDRRHSLNQQPHVYGTITATDPGNDFKLP